MMGHNPWDRSRNAGAWRGPAPSASKARTPWSAFSALTLIDPGPHRNLVAKVLDEHGMHVFSAAAPAEAGWLVGSRRVDLAVCDLDNPIIEQAGFLSPLTSWRGVTIALTSEAHTARVSGLRSHFMVQKPINSDLLARTLRASYTMLARKLVSTYRLNMPLKVISGTLNHRGWQRTINQAKVLNVSMTGLCLQSESPLPQGAVLSMGLQLPESNDLVHASGSVVWSDREGRSGVDFHGLPGVEMKKLQVKLLGRLPQGMESVLSAH